MTQQAMAMGIDMILLAPEYLQDRSPNGLVARLRSAWRAALENVRRNPLTLREPAPPPYWSAALSAADILSILQGSARESGEPLALS